MAVSFPNFAMRQTTVGSKADTKDFPDRSSCVFCKKGVLRNFAKFTGKHLCPSLFFNKVAGRPETLAQVFSCEFCEISKNTLFYRTLPVAASVLSQIKSNFTSSLTVWLWLLSQLLFADLLVFQFLFNE